MRLFPLVISFLLLGSCAGVQNAPKYELSDGYYDFREDGKVQKGVYVAVRNDTLQVFGNNMQGEALIAAPHKKQTFLKKSFDLDVMTIAFKYRPSLASLPRQLSTDFNGNVYLGYRFDRFKVRVTDTPAGLKKSYRHRGVTIGGFGGLGATAMTPWTTNNLMSDEYTGVVLTRGVAVMVAINNLTVGTGIGWDYLTDRDKHIWIYQNAPWYGLTVGLNIN